MKNTSWRVARILQVSFLMWILAACTHVTTVPVTVERYPEGDNINLRVGLRLSEELRNAKSDIHIAGDTFRILLGDTLSQNAENLAQELFSEVVVINSVTSFAEAEMDAILIPRVVLIKRTRGTSIFSISVFTIMLEWKLVDLKGNTIWVDTIKGEVRKQGAGMGKDTGSRTMIEDLFQNSFKALSSSPEIREFAATQGRMGSQMVGSQMWVKWCQALKIDITPFLLLSSPYGKTS